MRLPRRKTDALSNTGLLCRSAKMGWPTGLEPATARTTIWSSTIELRPPLDHRQTNIPGTGYPFVARSYSLNFTGPDSSLNPGRAYLRNDIRSREDMLMLPKTSESNAGFGLSLSTKRQAKGATRATQSKKSPSPRRSPRVRRNNAEIHLVRTPSSSRNVLWPSAAIRSSCVTIIMQLPRSA